MENKKDSPVSYYPIFLNLRGKHCVVVGAGEVAQRKIECFWSAAPKVTVISPTVQYTRFTVGKGRVRCSSTKVLQDRGSQGCSRRDFSDQQEGNKPGGRKEARRRGF